MQTPPARLLEVLELLQERPLTTGREIADRLEIDARTVRRYVEALQGLGIPVESLPHLFTEFYRAQAHSGTPGRGLGLYIARSLIEAHGGRIWAESEGRGRGSTFRFTLPYDSLDGPDAQRAVCEHVGRPESRDSVANSSAKRGAEE